LVHENIHIAQMGPKYAQMHIFKVKLCRETALLSRGARCRSSCAEKQAGLNVNNKRRSLMRQKFTKKPTRFQKGGRQRIRVQGRKAGSKQAESGIHTKDRTTAKRQQSSNREGKEWHNIEGGKQV